MLLRVPKNYIYMRNDPRIPFIVELEKQEHTKLYNAMIDKNREIYWDRIG